MRSASLFIQPLPLPSPSIMPIGDSGYCCLASIMNTSVEEAYHYVDLVRLHRNDVDQHRGPLTPILLRILAIVWNKTKLSKDLDADLSEQIIFTEISKLWDDIPKEEVQWPINPTNNIYRALKNNYALMTMIDKDGKNKGFSNLKHAVLITGLNDTEDGKTMLTVSCSIHGTWQCSSDEFLSDYGGFDIVPFLVV